MKIKITTIIALVLIALPLLSMAQQGQGRNMDPTAMADSEKELLYTTVTDLSDDQKVVIDEVYKQYSIDLKKVFDESAGNREGMREAMGPVRKNKEDLLKDILNEDQFEKAQKAFADRRGSRGRRPQQGNN